MAYNLFKNHKPPLPDFKCSNCSVILDEAVELEECDETEAVFGYRLVSWYKMKYCPNCGAKIDEVEE